MATFAEMTGQAAYGGAAPSIDVNEIHLQGKEKLGAAYPIPAGHFKLKLTTGPRDEKKGFEVKDLGDRVELVFLKIRRVLKQWRKDAPALKTNEHTGADDEVMLYGADGGPRYGNAKALRQAYQGLRTQQMVYAYAPSLNQIVRLVVKGASLMDDEDRKDVKGFYAYLSDTNKAKKNVHTAFTVLTPVLTGDYYRMSFSRGDELSEDRVRKIEEKIVELYGKTEEQDAYYAGRIARAKASGGASEAAPAEMPTISADDDDDAPAVEYPTDNIDPNDIPF